MSPRPWPSEAKVTVAVLAVVAVLVLVLGGQGRSPTESSGPIPTTTRAAPVVIATTVPEPAAPPAASATTAPPATTSASGQPVVLARLVIDDGVPPAGYDRALFPTWLDLDGNGCDARDDSLIAESRVPLDPSRCDLSGGRWVSLYDGVVVTDPSELDVDHVVPLAEAWRSGADAWSAPRRAGFANDLTYADHLIAVTASTNRSKSDSPPQQWRPPQEESWCRYATAWVSIKVTWSLTVTTPERDALGQMLATC